MVKLGITNSRMKDLHDIRSLCRDFSFDGPILSDAILNTFNQRKTDLPRDKPIVFTAEFYRDTNKVKQWNAFCGKNKLYIAEVSLESVCLQIEQFLEPVVEKRLREKQAARALKAPKKPKRLRVKKEGKLIIHDFSKPMFTQVNKSPA